MPGYQHTTIIGHVGRSPELRYTQSGTAVCDFSVAVNRKWTNRDSGEQSEDTTWFQVSAWRALAETCNQYVTQGMAIMVAGRVSASAYIDKSGEARATLELTAQDVQFLSRADAGERETSEDYPF